MTINVQGSVFDYDPDTFDEVMAVAVAEASVSAAHHLVSKDQIAARLAASCTFRTQ